MSERKDFTSLMDEGRTLFATLETSDLSVPSHPECANDSEMDSTSMHALANESGRRDQEFFQLRRLAESLYKRRVSRGRFFDKNMFGEPAWDMLLALYIAEMSRIENSVTQIASYTNGPATTALRWIDYLETRQLIVRTCHATDRRRQLVKLTDKARSQMDAYFRAVELPCARSTDDA